MKRLVLTFTTATFLLPVCASAHGEEVLFPVFIQFGSIVVFLILLALSKHEAARKLELGATYFLSLGLIVLFTWNIPYNENRIVLNFVMALGPAIITLLGYLFSKRTKSDSAE